MNKKLIFYHFFQKNYTLPTVFPLDYLVKKLFLIAVLPLHTLCKGITVSTINYKKLYIVIQSPKTNLFTIHLNISPDYLYQINHT